MTNVKIGKIYKISGVSNRFVLVLRISGGVAYVENLETGNKNYCDATENFILKPLDSTWM